ncbi:hypothetical protein [Rosistilla oblonga]
MQPHPGNHLSGVTELLLLSHAVDPVDLDPIFRTGIIGRSIAAE